MFLAFLKVALDRVYATLQLEEDWQDIVGGPNTKSTYSLRVLSILSSGPLEGVPQLLYEVQVEVLLPHICFWFTCLVVACHHVRYALTGAGLAGLVLTPS